MKLLIPPKCKIGAADFDIVFNDRLLEKMDLAAHISHREQKIILCHRKPDQMFHYLVHEAIHGVFNENEIGGNEVEQTISTLGVGLTNFLVSLGIEPNFSQISEEE